MLPKQTQSLIFTTLVWLACSQLSPLNAAPISFCLDFGEHPKSENFKKFDFSIHGGNSRANIAPAQAAGKQFYGYISVGQVREDVWYFGKVENRGIRFFGKNERWNSYLVDLSDSRWADFVIDTLAKAVVKKGYDGFFLDTLDSVENLMQRDPEKARSYSRGLVNLVKRLKAAYPEKRIITNRGFAVFDGLATTIDGMLVEELYQKDDYSSRSSHEVQELLDRIAPVTAAGLPIYIVDYVPRDDQDLADKTARKIAKLGFHPCVIPQEIDGTVLAPKPSSPPPPEKPKPALVSYDLVLSPGFNLVANQLEQGNNTIAEMGGSLPDGAACYVWDKASGQYSISTLLSGQWSNEGLQLKPGAGAFLFNPTTSNLVLKITGKIPGTLPAPEDVSGFALISCRRPMAARFEDVLGFPPASGDRVFRWRGGLYEIFSFWDPAWDREPIFDVGEAFFVDLVPRGE